MVKAFNAATFSDGSTITRSGKAYEAAYMVRFDVRDSGGLSPRVVTGFAANAERATSAANSIGRSDKWVRCENRTVEVVAVSHEGAK